MSFEPLETSVHEEPSPFKNASTSNEASTSKEASVFEASTSKDMNSNIVRVNKKKIWKKQSTAIYVDLLVGATCF